VRLNEIRAIAAGGLLVVVTSALLATTLLPGVLAWMGARIDLGRVRRRRAVGSHSDRWRRLGRLVTAHPGKALVLGATPLLLLAAQAARLRTGLPRGNWLPPTMESARALDDLRAMGRSNTIQAIRVVLALPAGSSVRRPAGWNGLALLVDTLGADTRVERIRSVVGIARAAGMGRSVITFLPDLSRGLSAQSAVCADRAHAEAVGPARGVAHASCGAMGRRPRPSRAPAFWSVGSPPSTPTTATHQPAGFRTWSRW
jgi:uncharacterized membrane protein YdfJ with MMPL/SSD domain